ncbi:DUF1553 domain-containing protein [Alienimonas californiensis]|uniref:Bacterial Ig-like domain (Group 2) n=1 Tax=Alienimonas californiensis TaxID=2527989 RepID=A0A517P9J1_9PLAN|nr:DUF1553 domain-containing protein [Alienimonas californiensis]QDT16025.1 Bacterial Ig-like domain (group 2) [Alienimonas californiensis]
MTPLLLAAVLLAAPAEATDAPGAGLAALPATVSLTGPADFQTLLLQTRQADGALGAPAAGAAWTSSDEAVVVVRDGRAVPTGNGQATLTATVGGQQKAVAVTVTEFDQPHAWSFRNHVQSVLTKRGCNMGACHGAAAGKGGFLLSLRGYDPETDFFAITRGTRGRRIVPNDPARSLLLTKPTAAVPHKGGLRFEEGSDDYAALSEWIAAGAPAPSPHDARLERLEILPERVRLGVGDSQPLVVVAHFTDGRTEDVTRWAKFSAADATVATVSEEGVMTVIGPGEGPVVAWYLARNVVSTAVVPRAESPAEGVFAEAPQANLIDSFVLEKLSDLNLPPSPRCDDATYLRRACLDVAGRLPTPEEVRAFLADDAPDKRERLVDELLASPEYVDYWTHKWSDLLLVSGDRLRPQAVESFYGWIRERVEENAGWDEFARGVVTAQGSAFDNGAANFFALHQDPEIMAETTSAAFLGMSIACAKCHDHPLEKWTNDQYYAFANLFGRVRGKGWGGDYRNGDGDRTIFVADEGDLIQPRTGEPQPPAPLDGEPLPPDYAGDRREALADWLVDPANPYFSRAIVNRVWENYMGVGLVDAVDDLRLTNPPSNPALMDALADYLVANDYDLKRLMRLILTSEAYQRSSVPEPGAESDVRYYSHFLPRRLKAEVLLDAFSSASGVPTTFKDRPEGTKAIQLKDSAVDSYFLDAFGRAERLQTCSCERTGMPSMKQVLHVMNGGTLNEKLAAADGRIAAGSASGRSDAELIEEAYLASVNRPPTEEEAAAVAAVLADTEGDDRRIALEDLYWGLLSSREFLFQH